MDPHMSRQIEASPAVAELRGRLDDLICYADAAALLELTPHTLSGGARYRHLRRVRVGRRKFLHLAEVLELLGDEPRSRDAARALLGR